MIRPASAQGIGCESCHGAAEHWLARHYERDISRAELQALGMHDTKDLRVRAAVCAGCHVGDERRDMNHDMIAAGHPPLRFELSAYHDMIRLKHWSDAERIEQPHFKARLWAAGQVVGAEAALALLESRAARAVPLDKAATSGRGDLPTPWPEFSEFDCFACHQRLRPLKAATSGRGSSAVPLRAIVPGIPGWQPWNLALAEQTLEPGAVALLRERLGRSLTTDAVAVQRLAAQARVAFRDHASSAPIFDAEGLRGEQLATFIERQIGPGQSWAASSQQLLALQAAYLASRDETRKVMPGMRLVAASSGPRFGPSLGAHDEQLQARIANLTAALRFGSAEFEWPAYDWQGLPPLDAPPLLKDHAEIIGELKRLAAQLQEPRTDGAP